ncbi:MAG: hypothetical protein H0X40_02840 [Chthoniobacterales bacterium]|nr:hypothetical protein [Chthoniobacterales bacterium]
MARDSKCRSAEQFLRQQEGAPEPLISLPEEEALTRLFKKGFATRGLRFAIGVEVASLESLRTYAAAGFGVGLSVANPEASDDPALRVLPLAKFPKLVLGALWTGKLSEIARSFLDEIQRHAKELTSSRAE